MELVMELISVPLPGTVMELKSGIVTDIRYCNWNQLQGTRYKNVPGISSIIFGLTTVLNTSGSTKFLSGETPLIVYTVEVYLDFPIHNTTKILSPCTSWIKPTKFHAQSNLVFMV